MKQIVSMLLLINTLISCNNTSKNEIDFESKHTEEIKQKIDEYFSALTKIGKFNGVVLVTKTDTI